MVSAGVCFCDKERLHFVDQSAKVDSAYVGRRRLHSTVARWIRLPARWCASTHSSCHAELALNQLPRFHCLQFHPTWTLWITMSGGQCWRPITSAIRNRKRSPNWKKSCRWSGTAYLRDQQTKLSKSSQSDWRPVLQLRMDISNIHSNCNVETLLLLLERCYFT